ncbi:hypothetical protein HYH03_008209 [Edaphochlamys debaryana]|uniref:Protein farnesyltransferase/geranylgeranyltransferase type-1 subunit alpha n=1 Tax=Edaphochlamys debaryana TaxID=47281 RepID=A0A835Y0T9_9CHLO|nr:hypothetical protein HYH03_008209 [Edaphochlamys debaryana]|eukprot:KAG2493695.1 hypothetical protein HYH03_008209 [Edaphochlamys debaryana]
MSAAGSQPAGGAAAPAPPGPPLPYAQRPDWADVTPVHIPEEAVVAIQYTAEHSDALGYFRAVVRSGELSPRVLALTADMIRFNQADYTAWRVRWRCVQALGPEALASELDFTHAVMLENAKNYQLWNHRRLCALQLGAACADREDAFTREAIAFDEKNYHAWAHRQAVVRVSGRWAAELAFAAELIERDVRNNTAWNQRMFCLQHMPREGADDAAWLRRELEYVAGAIAKAPRNEAPWRYLTGLFATLQPWAGQPRALSTFPDVHQICQEALQECPACAPALDVMAAYYEGLAALGVARAQQQLAAAGGAPGAGPVQGAVAGVLHAVAAANSALEEAGLADPMRAPYWFHRMRGLTPLQAQAEALLA